MSKNGFENQFVPYSYKSTSAYAEEGHATAQDGHQLFELPSERYGKDLTDAHRNAQTVSLPSTQRVNGERLIPVEMSLHDVEDYLMYRSLTYGEGEGPDCNASVKMPTSDMRSFEGYKKGAPIEDCVCSHMEEKKPRTWQAVLLFVLSIIVDIFIIIMILRDGGLS